VRKTFEIVVAFSSKMRGALLLAIVLIGVVSAVQLNTRNPQPKRLIQTGPEETKWMTIEEVRISPFAAQKFITTSTKSANKVSKVRDPKRKV